MLTDGVGERPIIDRFVTDASIVYGISDAGVYRLDTHNQWKQISSEVPDKVSALAIVSISSIVLLKIVGYCTSRLKGNSRVPRKIIPFHSHAWKVRLPTTHVQNLKHKNRNDEFC